MEEPSSTVPERVVVKYMLQNPSVLLALQMKKEKRKKQKTREKEEKQTDILCCVQGQEKI